MPPALPATQPCLNSHSRAGHAYMSESTLMGVLGGMRLHARLILLVGMAAGPALALLIQNQFDNRAGLRANIHRKAADFATAAALHSEATIQGLRHVLIGLGT